MDSVLCSVMSIAVLRGTPALIRLRDPERRKSWGCKPVYRRLSPFSSYTPSPSLWQVRFHMRRKFFMLNAGWCALHDLGLCPLTAIRPTSNTGLTLKSDG